MEKTQTAPGSEQTRTELLVTLRHAGDLVWDAHQVNGITFRNDHWESLLESIYDRIGELRTEIERDGEETA